MRIIQDWFIVSLLVFASIACLIPEKDWNCQNTPHSPKKCTKWIPFFFIKRPVSEELTECEQILQIGNEFDEKCDEFYTSCESRVGIGKSVCALVELTKEDQSSSCMYHKDSGSLNCYESPSSGLESIWFTNCEAYLPNDEENEVTIVCREHSDNEETRIECEEASISQSIARVSSQKYELYKSFNVDAKLTCFEQNFGY